MGWRKKPKRKILPGPKGESGLGEDGRGADPGGLRNGLERAVLPGTYLSLESFKSHLFHSTQVTFLFGMGGWTRLPPEIKFTGKGREEGRNSRVRPQASGVGCKSSFGVMSANCPFPAWVGRPKVEPTGSRRQRKVISRAGSSPAPPQE